VLCCARGRCWAQGRTAAGRARRGPGREAAWRWAASGSAPGLHGSLARVRPGSRPGGGRPRRAWTRGRERRLLLLAARRAASLGTGDSAVGKGREVEGRPAAGGWGPAAGREVESGGCRGKKPPGGCSRWEDETLS
jgi:hypothetical protein